MGTSSTERIIYVQIRATKKECAKIPISMSRTLRGWRRHFGTAKIVKSTAHPHGDAFFRNASREKCKHRKQKPTKKRSGASQCFMFHYVLLVAWEPSWTGSTVTICCTLFTNCCTPHASPN